LYQRVYGLLVDRGLKERQVARLLEGKAEEAIARIRDIIEYFDKLRASGSKLVSRSPVGFLYRAVEKPEQFVLPGEEGRRPTQTALELNRDQPRAVKTVRELPQANSLESEYLVERRLEIKRLRNSLEPTSLRKMQAEVEGALMKLKGVLSDSRLQEVIQHGVDEKIAKLFAVPEFDEWVKERTRRLKKAADA
jgi:hypothetical protein